MYMFEMGKPTTGDWVMAHSCIENRWKRDARGIGGVFIIIYIKTQRRFRNDYARKLVVHRLRDTALTYV